MQAGQVDRRVLAALEFLSVSGLKPTVASLGCKQATVAGAANAAGGAVGDTLDISAIDGTPIAGHEEAGSLADIAVRRLLRLQGTMKPHQIATGSLSYPGTSDTLTLPTDRGMIHVSFEAAGGARAAKAQSSPLTPDQWLELVSRLGEIPDPIVAGKPSSAAIPDNASATAGKHERHRRRPGRGMTRWPRRCPPAPRRCTAPSRRWVRPRGHPCAAPQVRVSRAGSPPARWRW